ncbi:MAG: hypothetical protein ABI880_10405 [Acidobacteriota bacterium]
MTCTPVPSRMVPTRLFVVMTCLLLGGLWPQPAAAQVDAGSARALFTQLIVNRQLGPFSNPQRTQDLIDEFSKSIAIGISTAPVGASSAGFSYEFDPRTGEHTLKSQSFGPLFVERPYTNGKGVFNAGLGFTHASYSKFEGRNLNDDGVLLFDNRVRFLDDNYEQFITEYLTATPKVTTVNLLASYGVTRSLDIGVVVPWSSLKIDARRYWNYDVSRSYPFTPSDQAYFTKGPKGSNFDPTGSPNTGSVSASGVGDITLRAKYGFGAQGRQAAAAVVDVRLPTGDEDNFLGAGKTSTRLSLIASSALTDTLTFHVNGGYRVGGLTDQGDYGVALDAALLPSKKLTVSAELLGQYLKNGLAEISELKDGPLDRIFPLGDRNINVIYSAAEPQFLSGGVNILRGAFGVKYNVTGTTLLTAGVLLPISDKGLTSSATAFIGLDLSLSGK